jgi:hypothetical protein
MRNTDSYGNVDSNVDTDGDGDSNGNRIAGMYTDSIE